MRGGSGVPLWGGPQGRARGHAFWAGFFTKRMKNHARRRGLKRGSAGRPGTRPKLESVRARRHARDCTPAPGAPRQAPTRPNKNKKCAVAKPAIAGGGSELGTAGSRPRILGVLPGHPPGASSLGAALPPRLRRPAWSSSLGPPGAPPGASCSSSLGPPVAPPWGLLELLPGTSCLDLPGPACLAAPACLVPASDRPRLPACFAAPVCFGPASDCLGPADAFGAGGGGGEGSRAGRRRCAERWWAQPRSSYAGHEPSAG